MSSVARDIFFMPPTRMNAKKYDCVVACVDRHSGWIVAIRAQRNGLTGAKVAKKMLKHQWQIFGLPNVITSDQGSHFVSSWFQTLASGLGVRQAFSQAYHHQANGRAEMAGQQLMEKLRKMHADEGINWAESLESALRVIHDTPGITGLTLLPNFVRERPKRAEPATQAA